MPFTERQSIEIFHLLFLEYLGNKVDKRLFILKGGCNLRFFFNSMRYSEDIDFDLHTMSRDTFEKNVSQLLAAADLQTQALVSLKSISYDDYAGQVVAYLEESAKPDFQTHDTWERMCKNVAKYIGEVARVAD